MHAMDTGTSLLFDRRKELLVALPTDCGLEVGWAAACFQVPLHEEETETSNLQVHVLLVPSPP